MNKKFNPVHEKLNDGYILDSSSPSTSCPNSPSSQRQFIQKLVEMLEDRSNSNYISWNRAGTSVIIRDIEAFSQIVLPKYDFKTTNFNSLVRQLNMYNFHKVKNGGSKGSKGENKYLEFKNENFIRDKPHLRVNIKRKSNEKDNEVQTMYYELQNSYNQLFSYVTHLKQKLEEVDHDNQILKEMVVNLKDYVDKRFDDISDKAPNNSLNPPENKYENKYDKKYDNNYENNYDNNYENNYENKYDNKYENKYDNKYENKYENNYENNYDNKYQNDKNASPHMRSPKNINDRPMNPKSNDRNYLGNSEYSRYSPNNSDNNEDAPSNPIKFDYSEG